MLTQEQRREVQNQLVGCLFLVVFGCVCTGEANHMLDLLFRMIFK